MKMKPVIAIAALAAGLMVVAPGEAEAQYYGHGYYTSTPYSYYPGSHYGSNYSRYSRDRYSHYRYKTHPGRGHAYGKYKNKSKYRHDRSRKPDVSIGPRWDPHHGWVYF